MEKRMSSDDERRLVRAVEKAATLALADESKDRSQLLANCLLEANVDSRFAHVASAAFNKRLTVLRFQRLPDERKEDSFDLSDAATVASCMGVGCNPAASCDVGCVESEPREDVFVIEMGEAPTQVLKVASAAAAKPAVRYEDRVPVHVMERHLESMMQKLGAVHSEMLGKLRSLEADVEKRAGELSKLLKRASAFDRQVVCNVHGTPFCSVMNAYDPELGLKKTAMAIDDGSHLSRLAGQLVKKATECLQLNDKLANFQQGLSEFTTEAAAYGKAAHKLNKKAYFDDPDLLADAAELGGALLDIGGAGIGSFVDATRQGVGTVAALIGESLSTPNRVKDTALAPSLILNERYRNRLMAWSDMGADRLFASYPAQQVFDVTNKLMNANADLELPENRELLRAHVGQALAQGGRLGTADMQALYSTLASAGRASKERTTAMTAAQAASERLRDRAAPAETKSISDVLGVVYKPTDSLFDKHTAKSKADFLREVAEKYTEKLCKGRKEREDEQKELQAKTEREQKELDAYKRDVLSRAKGRLETPFNPIEKHN